VGFVFSTYLLPGRDYKLQSWAMTEEKSHLYISLDKNSRFFHHYMEKLESIEKELKEGCSDLMWAASVGLTFKIHAFEKCSSGGDRRDVPESSSNTLAQQQLTRTTNIQLTSESEDTISPTMITRGDLMVVKCHLRYWRNNYNKQHGLTKYLLGVKLLNKVPQQLMSREQLDVF
jgi:hypothetical protein